jgi:putative transposase
MTPRGGWVQPVLFGVIDDRSRLLCHLQWYLDAENMRDVAHGLMQALLRRGLPRAVLSEIVRGDRDFQPFGGGGRLTRTRC